MRLHVGCSFTYRAETATPTVFQVQPSPCHDLRMAAEVWMLEPFGKMRHYKDLYRNTCMRTVLPAGRSTLRYAASVDASGAPEEERDLNAPEVAPDELPAFNIPARYVFGYLPSRVHKGQ